MAKTAVAMSAAFAAVTIVIYLVLPGPLIGLFIDPADPERPMILAIGVSLLAVAALFQLVDGLQVIALGLLRGLHDTRVPMIYAAISYWVIGIPTSYVLGFVLGWRGVGIWLGLVVGLALAATLLILRFWSQIARRAAPAGPIWPSCRPFAASSSSSGPPFCAPAPSAGRASPAAARR